MSTIGSESWLGSSNYEAGNSLHERAESFVASVSWTALSAIASRLRDNVSCSLSHKYSMGHFNLVRRISFEDGVEWIVRLRLPDLHEVFGRREALDVRSSMRMELATTAYLRENTSIPFAEVFESDLSPDNEVGAPYVFMSYVHGTAADKLRESKDCELGLFGNQEQDQKFRQQMAQIQVELASIQFNQIGSIHFDEQGRFCIGPDIETGLGPWNTPREYYKDYTNHIVANAKAQLSKDGQESESFDLPHLFWQLMELCAQLDHKGPFGLANLDFGAHNLLVDDDFNIVALIDLDGIIAAPIELIAQLPVFAFLDTDPPGSEESNPWALARREREAPVIERYIHVVRDRESEVNIGGSNKTPVSDCMLSDAASLAAGLRNYAGNSKRTNDRWFASFQTLMNRRCKQEDLAI